MKRKLQPWQHLCWHRRKGDWNKVELWFLDSSFFFVDIYLYLKFHVNTLHLIGDIIKNDRTRYSFWHVAFLFLYLSLLLISYQSFQWFSRYTPEKKLCWTDRQTYQQIDRQTDHKVTSIDPLQTSFGGVIKNPHNSSMSRQQLSTLTNYCTNKLIELAAIILKSRYFYIRLPKDIK